MRAKLAGLLTEKIGAKVSVSGDDRFNDAKSVEDVGFILRMRWRKIRAFNSQRANTTNLPRCWSNTWKRSGRLQRKAGKCGHRAQTSGSATVVPAMATIIAVAAPSFRNLSRIVSSVTASYLPINRAPYDLFHSHQWNIWGWLRRGYAVSCEQGPKFLLKVAIPQFL